MAGLGFGGSTGYGVPSQGYQTNPEMQSRGQATATSKVYRPDTGKNMTDEEYASFSKQAAASILGFGILLLLILSKL